MTAAQGCAHHGDLRGHVGDTAAGDCAGGDQGNCRYSSAIASGGVALCDFVSIISSVM